MVGTRFKTCTKIQGHLHLAPIRIKIKQHFFYILIVQVAALICNLQQCTQFWTFVMLFY